MTWQEICIIIGFIIIFFKVVTSERVDFKQEMNKLKEMERRFYTE